MDDFPPAEDRPQRARGINSEKLTEKKDKGDFNKKIIPVFFFTPGTGLNEVCKLPSEGLLMFSDKFREKILDKNEKSVQVYGDLDANKEILRWMRLCIDAGEVQEFEEYDENDPTTMSRYAKIIRAANDLQVPARDFQEKILKRMKRFAKFQRESDRRMSWDEIENIYATKQEDSELDETLCRVAAATIFFSWWNGHLDSETTPEEMCYLSALREDYPDLDQHLHDEFEDQKNFLDERKKKRDAERAGIELGEDGTAAGGLGAGWGADAVVATAAGGGASSWENNISGGDGGGSSSWENNVAGGGGADWENTNGDTTGGMENVYPAAANPAPWDQSGEANSGGGGGGGDWADEMNTASAGW